MTGPAQARIEVNVDGQMFASAEMAVADAQQAADDLRKAVIECGAGWWFFKFPALEGDTWIRGRDVIAIQTRPVTP